jgi:hypothetical protein
MKPEQGRSYVDQLNKRPRLQKLHDRLYGVDRYAVFKHQVWQAYEPHLHNYLEDPESFGIPSMYLPELQTEPRQTLRDILLRTLEDKNADFLNMPLAKNERHNIVGYKLFLSNEEIKTYLSCCNIKRPISGRKASDEVGDDARKIFNILHNIVGGNWRYHQNTNVDWLRLHGVRFQLNELEDKSRDKGKKKRRFKFSPIESVTDGYLVLSFKEPLVYP